MKSKICTLLLIGISTGFVTMAQVKSLPRSNMPTTNTQLATEKPATNNSQPKPPQKNAVSGNISLPTSAKAMESWQSGIYQAKFIGSSGKGITQSFRLHKTEVASTKNSISTAPAPKYSSKVVNSSEENKNGFVLNCENRITSVRLDDNTFLKVNVEAQAAQVYPGAIYKFDDFMSGGYSGISLPRNPITLGTTNSNISGSAKELVADPTQTNIFNAISQMFGRFPIQPEKVRSSSFSFLAYEVFSQEDLMLKAGASGHYMGFSARNDFDYNKRESRRYFLIDMTKEMYTIFCEQPSNGFLVNPADITNDMIYVSSVTYGMRAMAMVEVKIKSVEMKNSFSAKYDGLSYGGQIDLDIFSKDAGEESTVKMYLVGGTSEQNFPAFTIGDLKKRLEDLAKTLNYNTASPIKYVLSHVGLNRVIKYSTLTDQFNETSCEPVDTLPKLYNYETKITDIRINNSSENDVDPFGWVTAELQLSNGAWVPPVRGQRLLFSVPEQHYIRREQISNGAGYLPNMIVNHVIAGSDLPEAKLRIFFGLTDHDDWGNDEIQVHGNPKLPGPDGRNHSAVEIYLNSIKLNEPYILPVTLVDNDGDYPFTISITITKTLVNK